MAHMCACMYVHNPPPRCKKNNPEELLSDRLRRFCVINYAKELLENFLSEWPTCVHVCMYITPAAKKNNPEELLSDRLRRFCVINYAKELLENFLSEVT